MMERKMIGVTVTGGELAPRLTAVYEERPVVVQQQPRHNPATHKVDAFRNIFAILLNLDDSELSFLTHDQLRAMRDSPFVAILLLDDARLDALYALVQSRQPERYRDAA